MSRDRSETDRASGLGQTAKYAEYPEYDAATLDMHFKQFQDFDVDGSGFISPENLKAILDAMEISVDFEVVQGMITEVAILCNHDDDGMLSFRDYMQCIEYEKKRDEHNRRAEEALAAAEECYDLGIGDVDTREARISMASVRKESVDGPPPVEALSLEEKGSVEDEEVEITEKMRGTSFAVMKNLAQSRIAAFKEQVAAAEVAAPPTPAAAAAADEKKKDVIERIQKFKRVEADSQSKAGKLKLASENIEAATLKNKLAAFEQARKDAMNDHHTIQKSWKKSGFRSC